MQEQTAGPRKREGRASALSRARFLDAAMALVERGGPEALTLRALGAALGANHTAVLRHFDSKDEIVLGLAERMLEEALGGFVPGDSWRDTLSELARRIRGVCHLHTSVASLVTTRVSRSPAEFRGADMVLGALEDAGLEGREAALVYRAITDLALAVGSYEASCLTIDKSAREGDRTALAREYLLASPRDYPHLAAVAPHLAGIDEDEQFETALELVLDGVEYRVARCREV